MKAVSIVASLACAAAVAGCAGSAGSARQVEIAFEVVVNGQPARCGQPLGRLGQDATPAALRDARLYVQDVSLIAADGRREPVSLAVNGWQNGVVALLDFEDGTGHCTVGTPATNRVVTGTVPAGRYTGLAFAVGVPQALNHTSTELEGAPLDIAGMGWSWQAGRKFARLEVDPEGGVAKPDGSRSASWFVHLGSTGCSGNPVTGETVSCLRPNRLPVVMDRFDTATQRVVLDLGALLRDSRIAEDKGGAVGCMSNPADPECKAVFGRLGLSLSDGLPVMPGQSSVFSAGPRP